jgi:hypothetical protein
MALGRSKQFALTKLAQSIVELKRPKLCAAKGEKKPP